MLLYVFVDCCCYQNIPDALIDKVGGKVYTFGSFRLGISAKGSDRKITSCRVHTVVEKSLKVLEFGFEIHSPRKC